MPVSFTEVGKMALSVYKHDDRAAAMVELCY